MCVCVYGQGATDGLEAGSAASFMRLLADVADEWRLAVLCTLDQPSARTYAAVDSVLLLSKGCTAYSGHARGQLTWGQNGTQ